MNVAKIEIDACYGGCGGIWLDNQEIKKIDETHEIDAKFLKELASNQSTKPDPGARLRCPKCSDHPLMMRHFANIKKHVEVDECGFCGGFWLDAGELSKMHEDFGTEAERDAATKRYFDDTFGPELQKMQKESAEKLASAQKFAHALRFICPSYYIPGKQEGGAF